MILRVQIAIALGVLAAVAAVTAALFSYASVDNRLQAETDTFLDDRISQVLTFLATRAEIVDNNPELPRESDLANPNTVLSIARYDVEMQFLFPDGRVVASTPDAVLPITQAEIDQALQSREAIPSQEQVGDRTFDTRLVGFDSPAGQRVVLQIGRDVTGQIATLEQLRFRLILLVSAVIVAGAAAGYFLASKLVRPLDKLRVATRAIADTKDFSEGIMVKGTGEIADVAADFNVMLGKLDQSLLQQRRLVQDASHELRAPLSTLRANVELSQRMALRSSEPESEHIALLGAALGEVDELSRLVDELVNLASFPFDESPIELLDLAGLTTGTVEAFRLRHPDRPAAIHVGENEPINGKRAHLERAVANVLANAVKFSAAGTPVDVEVEGNRIIVNDRGPGILEAELDRIFDRFYRSPTVQTIEGSGLGLAFVAEVVQGHGGTVRAKNRDGGGTTIILDIPPAA
jgi:two-component system sensor histidine kinase MprB